MASTFAVDIEFRSKGGRELQQLTKQTEALQKAAEGSKVDALNTALGVIPGRAGAAVNGIVGLTRGLKEAQSQARATAAEIAALQAALASKKIQLGAKGGIGGESLKKEIAGIESALAGAKGSGGAMALGLGAVAVAGAAAAAGMVAVTASAVSFTNEIDRNRQQLTLFTKDVAVTNRIIASLQRTADNTSLGLPGLLEATKTLSAYGIEAQNAGAATKMLGDLALGDNEKLQRFAVNFAQIASLGKAYTVDLKQFGMAGIPIFDALSKATGKSTAEIMKMAEEGRITYPLVVKALQDLTKEGASFYRGAERGGTDMDRAVQQMLGSWEKLQQKIGTAVGPTIVGAIKAITESLDGLLVATHAIGNEFTWITEGPLRGFINDLAWALKATEKLLKESPQLLAGVPGIGGGLAMFGTLQKFGRKSGTPSKSDAAADERERARLAADAQRKAEIEAKAAVAKLNQENAKKIAAVNLDTERSLAEARLGYEERIADFRRQQIEKIADMERQLGDERRSEEFKIAQLRETVASNQRLGQLDQQILEARVGGRDTTALESARAVEADRNAAARKRADIEFNATERRIAIERRLTDFKRETQRQMGEMQLSYTRETGGILRKAGQSVQDLMVKGAQQAKEILESVQMNVGSDAAGGNSKIGDIAAGNLTPETRALLKTIRFAEGTAGANGYNTMFTGKQFSDLSRHPRQIQRSGGYASDAAGAYQFLSTTWDSIGGGAMTPERQDRGAVALIRNRGVNPLLPNGFTPQVADRLAPEWASFPTLATGTSYYGQGGKSYAQLKRYYDQQLAIEKAKTVTAPGGVFANPAAPSSLTAPGGIFYNPASAGLAAAQAGKAAKGPVPVTVVGAAPSVAQAVAAPTAPALPAANNIVPTGSIPTTSPGLENTSAELERLNIQEKLIQKRQAELELTSQIRDAANGVAADQAQQLKSATDRNAVEMRTLELMRSGVSPELAAQRASNEQLIKDSAKGLEISRSRAEAAVAEKDITAETKAERQKVLDAINAQIAAQPGLLGQLDAEAQKTQAIADQRAARDQAKSDAQGISSTLTGGIKDAIKAAVTGGDVKAALSGMLASLGEKFLDMAMRPIEDMLTKGLMSLMNPQAMATQANTMALQANTMALQSAAIGGGGGFGGAGGILGGLGGLFGGGGGLWGAASGVGFNPIAFTPGLSFFAEGGFVTGPTRALIGEGGEPEYVLPASKMPEAMGRYAQGKRGGAVLETTPGGDSANSAAGVNLSMSFQTTQFLDREWVDRQQLEAAMAKAARDGGKAGEQRAMQRLQYSRNQRSRLGI